MDEDITIPVNVGDTILTGRFKNKKTKVKSIGKDEHGMPTINGRKVATFRIHKQVNIFDEEIYFDEEKTVEQILSQKIKPKIKKLSNGLDNWRYVNEEDKKDYDILLECSKKLEQLVKLGYRKKRLRYEDSSLENSVFGF